MIRPMHLTFAVSAIVAAIACSGSNDPATSDPAGDGDGDGDGDTVGDGDGDGDDTGDGDVSGTGGSGDGDGDGDGLGGGDGDSTGEIGDPPCDLSLTSGGMEIAKGVECTDADPQMCWRGCGPDNVGWKSETCTGGAYVEGQCQFPTGITYECYAIPDTPHEMCPAEAPMHGSACTVPSCNVCSGPGTTYMTSSMEVKTGYCVCTEPDSEGLSEWKCASGTAWPCPFEEGCTP